MTTMLIFNLLLLISTGVVAMTYLTATNSHGKFVQKKNLSKNDSIYYKINNGSSKTYKRGFGLFVNAIKSLFKKLFRKRKLSPSGTTSPSKTTSPRKPFKLRKTGSTFVEFMEPKSSSSSSSFTSSNSFKS